MQMKSDSLKEIRDLAAGFLSLIRGHPEDENGSQFCGVHLPAHETCTSGVAA